MKTTIGMILLALGLTTSVTSAVNAVGSMTGFAGSIQRVTNAGTVHFEEPGRYMLFYEQRTLIDGKPYFAPGGKLRFGLQHAATGEAVPVPNVNGSFEYSFGGREGEAIATFNIARPGDYHLAGLHTDGSPIVLAVARPLGGSIAKTFAFGFLAFVGLGVLVAGLLVFLMALSKRRRQSAAH